MNPKADDTHGRRWGTLPPAAVKKFFRPQKWNTMTVSAHGRRTVVNVNGTQTAELKNERGRLKGHLALQLHRGQDVEVAFKDVEILSEAKKVVECPPRAKLEIGPQGIFA